MISFPNAKINIGLNILRKREDGFHEIESLFYPVGLCDVLEVVKSDSFQFTSSGLPIPGDSSGNLCVKAFEKIQRNHGIGNVKMHLHKVIPMGAGLGGGSADGSFCINLLNELYDLRLPLQTKLDYAAQLGSDCAFFIENNPAVASGRGEVLTPSKIDLTGKYIVIVNPGIHVGTPEAYRNALIDYPEVSLVDTLEYPIKSWKGKVTNGFENSVLKTHPIIDELKNQLYTNGAIYASMTGSGSTVYGIFDYQPTYKSKDFYCWSGTL